jgi:hypothetical protein
MFFIRHVYGDEGVAWLGGSEWEKNLAKDVISPIRELSHCGNQHVSVLGPLAGTAPPDGSREHGWTAARFSRNTRYDMGLAMVQHLRGDR